MGFKLIRLDAVDEFKIPLQVGSHIIGRDDSLLNCQDQRVSRNHAVINVSDDTVILQSLHQNPCFYRKPCLPKPSIVGKGEWVSLCNTDHFGLLPDAYWYELIFCDETPLNKPNALPEMEINDNGQDINPPLVAETKQATRAIGYYVNTYSSTNQPEYDGESDTDTLNFEYEIEEGESQSLIKSGNPVPESPNMPPLNTQSPLPCSSDHTISKRSHSPEHSYDAKKVKKETESPNGTHYLTKEPHITEEAQLEEALLREALPDEALPDEALPEEALLEEGQPEEALLEEAQPEEPQFEEAQPVVHQINTIIDPQIPIDGANMDPQNVNYVYTALPNPATGEPMQCCENALDILLSLCLPPLQPGAPQGPGDANIEPERAYEVHTIAVAPNPNALFNQAQGCSSAEVKQEPQTPGDQKPELVMPGSSQSHDGPGCSNDAGAGAAPPPHKQPDRPRERCMYGAQCYRRNPQHKLQFSHPSDGDYGDGALGRCPYGASCWRTDPRHWQQHAHPPGTAPPQQQQGIPVRKRQRRVVRQPSVSEESDQDSPSPNLILDGKRKRKTVKIEGWSDSEEEARDPYATDESDDWNPDSDVTKM